MRKLKWLIPLVLLLVVTGCSSSTSSNTTQKVETIKGTIKEVVFYQGGRGSLAQVQLVFTDNSTVSFTYSGEQKILARLLNLDTGQTVYIQCVRLEPFPMVDQYPTKDIISIEIGKWPIN